MPVITINGPIGSGPAPVVGQMVADMLGLNFVDRLIFTTAARMMGAPVGALIEKEQRIVKFRDRLGRLVQTMLERSAVSGVSAEPYFGRGLETLPPEIYSEMAGSASATLPQVDDKVFIDATTTVVKDLYRQGNVVIIGKRFGVLETRTYAIPQTSMNDARSVGVRRYLEDLGVPFPEGASAHYEFGNGKLLVRNTASSLDKLDRIVRALGGTRR